MLNLVVVPCIVTNVPGAPEAATLAGGKILRWTALPPTGGRGVLGVGMFFEALSIGNMLSRILGIITYDNTVLVTCHVDR